MKSRGPSGFRYSERLAEAGIEPSVGSVGDSYDNAMAESIIGLFKTEVIERQRCRDGHAHLATLVQTQAAAAAYRGYPTGRGRSSLVSTTP